MSKLRISTTVLCILSSVICAVWALPPLTSAQQKAKARCDSVFNQCFGGCGSAAYGPARDKCQNGCINQLAACYGKIGIQAPPRNRLTNGKVPQGTLTQASPTATPRGGVRQPQGTLTQASPTPTPTPHQSPSTKKKSGGH
jgi:hypothetical protein